MDSRDRSCAAGSWVCTGKIIADASGRWRAEGVSALPANEHASRIESLRKIVITRAEPYADVVLLTCRDGEGWEEIFYFTGFVGTSSALLVAADEAMLIVDARYEEASRASTCSSIQCSDLGGRTPLEAALYRIRRLGLSRIAYGGINFPHSTLRMIDQMLGGVDTVDISRILFAARRHKSADEIARIRRAVEIAERSYREVLREARPGMTERSFAAMLISRVLSNGGDFFDPPPVMVASGERTSMPHATPGNRKMLHGDLVMVDFCVRWASYTCDITRMFSFGQPKEEIRRAYSALMWAQNEAAMNLRAGATAREIDGAARGMLTTGELGRLFSHATGHGIGLSVHELPSISQFSEETLVDGDVVTLEPGIYVPGEFGLRVEDDYAVTKHGAVCLTDGLSRGITVI